jgi:hypothetical protein
MLAAARSALHFSNQYILAYGLDMLICEFVQLGKQGNLLSSNLLFDQGSTECRR